MSTTGEEQLTVYREWKALNAVILEAAGGGTFRFDYLAQPPAGASSGTRSTGSIDATGKIDIDRQTPAGEPNCPICLARGTEIATPDGPIAVERLAIGDLVWSRDTMGRRVAVPILRLGSGPTPNGHRVVRLLLDDGRSVVASPGHPLDDGRMLGELHVGDRVAGATVNAATPSPYREGWTFDLQPSGPTGVYWADGIPFGSTLRAEPPPLPGPASVMRERRA